MDYQAFMDSLDEHGCPQGVSDYLCALWYDARGDWDRAHEIVQVLPGTTAARIHAYLHRKEGDDWNARYWHRRAGSEFPGAMSLQEEWESLVRELLPQPGSGKP
jgi:hypothetical protein